MGHSEVVAYRVEGRPRLYLAGEIRRGGCWAAIAEGPDPKFRFRRRWVGTKVSSRLRPNIAVHLVDLGDLPKPCLLNVRAGGTKDSHYEHILVWTGLRLIKLPHFHADGAVLGLESGRSGQDIARGLAALPELQEHMVPFSARSPIETLEAQ
jgi:hypothetical protein